MSKVILNPNKLQFINQMVAEWFLLLINFFFFHLLFLSFKSYTTRQPLYNLQYAIYSISHCHLSSTNLIFLFFCRSVFSYNNHNNVLIMNCSIIKGYIWELFAWFEGNVFFKPGFNAQHQLIFNTWRSYSTFCTLSSTLGALLWRCMV